MARKTKSLRGPILIVFGISLVASPLAINTLKSNQHAGVVSYGGASTACANSSLETVVGRLGCQRTAGDRTLNGSGAVFVRAGN